VSQATQDTTQEYRIFRLTGKMPGEELLPIDGEARLRKPPAPSTLHNEIGTLRLVLQTAARKRWLSHLPDPSPPFKTSGKIVHRPGFSPHGTDSGLTLI
jgi:hypothetical protein